MKKYFTKYLPVEGKGDIGCKWQWKNNIQNTGWEDISRSDMDAIIAHGLEPQPEFRKLKLFLCSRDIQIGDKVWFLDPNPNVGGFNDWSGFGTIFGIEDGMYGVDLGHTTTWEGIEDFAKVIGEILTPGIVENQEFTEKEEEYLTIGEKY